MNVKKYGNTITGAELTSAEKKALDIEINKAMAEWDRQNALEIDAAILWILHQEFKFGPERLKKFHNEFGKAMDDLIKRYEMSSDDGVWMCKHMLKDKLGIDVEEWAKGVYSRMDIPKE